MTSSSCPNTAPNAAPLLRLMRQHFRYTALRDVPISEMESIEFGGYSPLLTPKCMDDSTHITIPAPIRFRNQQKSSIPPASTFQPADASSSRFIPHDISLTVC